MSFLVIFLLVLLVGVVVSGHSTEAAQAETKCGLSIVEVGLNTRLFNALGRGLVAITVEGERVLALLEDQGVVALKRGNRFLAIITRGDIEVASQRVRTGQGTFRMARIRHETLLSSLSTNTRLDLTSLHTKALKKALKELSRTGVVRGVGGKGVTDNRLGFLEIALNPYVMAKLELRKGQHVYLTRFPQGSATAAMVEVVVTMALGQYGIIMNPALSLLLGGDHDGDEYYVYVPKERRFTSKIKVLRPLTAELLLQHAEAPGLVELMPQQKNEVDSRSKAKLRKMGWQDRTKVLYRRSIGIYTTLAYQAGLLVQGHLINDLFLPAQELIFDLFKFAEVLKLDITAELKRVISQPLEHRFEALTTVASRVHDTLKTQKAGTQYVEAFANLVTGSKRVQMAAKLFVVALRAGLPKADSLRPLFLDTRCVPQWDKINDMMYGKGVPCSYKLNGDDTLVSTKPGASGSKPTVDVSATLFSNEVVAVNPNDARYYLLGTKQSTLAVFFEDSTLKVVRRWKDDAGNHETTFEAVKGIEIETDYLGINNVSGKLMTCVEVGKRLINAHVVEQPINRSNVLDPLQYFAYCLYQAVNAQWRNNLWVSKNKTLHAGLVGDLQKVIRKSEVEWLRRAELKAHNDVGISFQSKAILFDEEVDQAMAEKCFNNLVGMDYMFVATKTADKGYVLALPGSKEYKLEMSLWYDATSYTEYISHNRVTREQTASHNVGQGQGYFIAAEVPDFTVSDYPDSLNALKAYKGEEHEEGRSTADCSALFSTTEYTLYKTVQVQGNTQLLADVEKYSAQGWSIEIEDRSFSLHSDDGEILPIVEGEGDDEQVVATVGNFTLRLQRQMVTKEGHAYKMYVGPGAKSMSRVVSTQKVTAIINGETIDITGLVSPASLQGKNAKQGVLQGSERVLGIKGLSADPNEHLQYHQANGSDESGRYPVYIDGVYKGHFVVLSMPYWMLPYTTEGRGTRIGAQPWVAPTCFDFAEEMAPTIPGKVKANYLKALLPVAIEEALIQQGHQLTDGQAPQTLEYLVNQVLHKTLGFQPINCIVDGDDAPPIKEVTMDPGDNCRISDEEAEYLASRYNYEGDEYHPEWEEE